MGWEGAGLLEKLKHVGEAGLEEQDRKRGKLFQRDLKGSNHGQGKIDKLFLFQKLREVLQ